MNREQLADLVQQFLFGFGTLFAIINPVRALVHLPGPHARPVRLRTEDHGQARRYLGLLRPCGVAGCGTTILGLFGISLPALRIGGGLVVAVSGWMMLHAPARQEDQAARSSQALDTLKSMTLFPLTIPLTTGPGSIATAIALAANRPPEMRGFVRSTIVSLIVTLAVSLTILHAYRNAGSMARLFGQEGTQAVTRLSAFLLLCVGVQIMLTGALDGIRPLLGAT